MRWPRLASTTAVMTKFREFHHSRWECGTGERRPGVPTRPHFRELLRERQNVLHRANFPLHWRVLLALGSSARRPMPHTGSRGLASAKVVASAQKMISHGGILREFGVVAR